MALSPLRAAQPLFPSALELGLPHSTPISYSQEGAWILIKYPQSPALSWAPDHFKFPF